MMLADFAYKFAHSLAQEHILGMASECSKVSFHDEERLHKQNAFES